MAVAPVATLFKARLNFIIPTLKSTEKSNHKLHQSLQYCNEYPGDDCSKKPLRCNYRYCADTLTVVAYRQI